RRRPTEEWRRGRRQGRVSWASTNIRTAQAPDVTFDLRHGDGLRMLGVDECDCAREDGRKEGAMAQVLAEVRLAGSPLQSYRHVCAFFRSPDEFYTVLLPFINEGFDRHERALHIVDPKLREEHIRRLEAV